MTLLEKISQDYTAAYKNKEELRVSVLRMLKSALKNAEIAKKDTLDEKEAIQTVKKEIKQREDSAAVYLSGGNTEKADLEQKEIDILKIYLPAQMSEEELKTIVLETIASLGASGPSDMGKVIGAIMQKYSSSVDGGAVSRLVKESLQK